MTTAVQHRRGTTAEHSTFTGLEGEVTIDTTKDTAVIHDGILAGGYPLAKENLANVSVSGLSTITGASTASDDKFFIYDQSATTLKTITRAELNNAMEADALANVTITGGTINGTTIGGTTAAAGSFTTLTASGTVTVPTPSNSTDAASKGYVDTSLANLVDSAPAALDTLNELAAALGDDANFSTTVTNSLATKAPLASPTFTGTVTIPTADINGGTIDGTTIGGTTPAAGTFTNLTATGTVTIPDNAISGDKVEGGTINAITINTLSAGNLAYTGTLTGGTGVVNIGSGQVYKDASGNVGIGTTSPDSGTPLHVAESSASLSANPVASAFLVERAGNVGMTLGTANTGLCSIFMGDTDSLTVGRVQYDNSGNSLQFWANSLERMRIDSSGNVGIGTSSPAAKLEVREGDTDAVSIKTDGHIQLYDNINSSRAYTFLSRNIGESMVGGNIRLDASVTTGSHVGYSNGTDLRGGSGILFVNTSGGAATYGETIFVQSNDTNDDTWVVREAMRIDSAGNVGIGTSSPSYSLDITGNAMRIRAASNSDYAKIGFTNAAGNTPAWIGIDGDQTSSLSFHVASNISASTDFERMRIDSSGNLLVGTTSKISAGYSGGLAVHGNTDASGAVFEVKNIGNSFSGRDLIRFYNSSNGEAGSIQHTTETSVSYLTSSDYRLKHDIQPMTGALAKVQALKPCTYKWNADDSDGEGFIAHELQEVCPSAVSGEKDAVNEDGSIKPQGIDTSFLVATLTAAIQEQQAIIESLTARVSALEGN